jgi:hypothetical protein
LRQDIAYNKGSAVLPARHLGQALKGLVDAVQLTQVFDRTAGLITKHQPSQLSKRPLDRCDKIGLNVVDPHARILANPVDLDGQEP